MTMTMERIAEILGVPAPAGGSVSGWSIDTRTLAPGDLFFALHGENHDGNAYVDEAFRKGAVAAFVDAQASLDRLGRAARRDWGGTIVGITGSAGKTSTKDIVAALLSVEMETGKNEGNLNNHIGVPLSILRLPDTAKVGVLEMGMNHAGEIRYLCTIAAPDIGVVTNVGHAHIENFESIDGIASAKRELIDSLPAGGTAVLNHDDPRVRDFSHSNRITYGIDEGADVRATNVELRADGSRFTVDQVAFETALVGRHSVRNILAGIATAKVFGIAPSRLVDAVRALAPGKMRGERFTHAGATVLNDSYNSNPDAARAMLDVLRDLPAARHIAVLGEMLELGHWSEPLHRDVGRYAAVQGVSVLVGIRGAARYLVDQARLTGMPDHAALFFEDPLDAGDALEGLVRPGDAILFKGSRGTRVEAALERWMA